MRHLITRNDSPRWLEVADVAHGRLVLGPFDGSNVEAIGVALFDELQMARVARLAAASGIHRGLGELDVPERLCGVRRSRRLNVDNAGLTREFCIGLVVQNARHERCRRGEERLWWWGWS